MVKSVKPYQLLLGERDPQLASQAMKKKKKNKAKKGGRTMATGVGLESFVDCVDLTTNEPAAERGRMICRALLLGSLHECVSELRTAEWSGLDGEAQNNLIVITVDSSERALDAFWLWRVPPRRLRIGFQTGGPPMLIELWGRLHWR